MIISKRTVLSLIFVLFAATASARSVYEETVAIKEYLKVLDSKIIASRAKADFPKVKALQAEKGGMLGRLAAIKDVPKGPVAGSVEAVRQSVVDDDRSVNISGEIRFAWTKGLENTNIKNNFDISRAYVTVRRKLPGGAAVRLTIDAARPAAVSSTMSATSQTLNNYVKYAYIDIPLGRMTAKLGLQHNMWIDWAEKSWGLSWIMKQFDDNEGIMPSADFGLGVTGKLLLPYIPEVEYHATLTNGGGYKIAESDSSKDIGLRVNTKLYNNDLYGTVIAGAYLNSKSGLFNSGVPNTKQAAVLLSFSNDRYGKAYAEYMKGTTINGSSIGGFVYPAKDILPLAVLARIDSFDPDNTSAASNDIARALFGALYEYSDDVKFSLNIQTYRSGGSAEQKTAYLNSVIYY